MKLYFFKSSQLATALVLSSGCFESDELRGLTSGDAVAEDTFIADASVDVNSPGDTADNDVPPSIDTTPGGLTGGLVGSGSVAASQNYTMVSSIGAVTADPMETTSESYRMTTSLLSFIEANP